MSTGNSVVDTIWFSTLGGLLIASVASPFYFMNEARNRSRNEELVREENSGLIEKLTKLAAGDDHVTSPSEQRRLLNLLGYKEVVSENSVVEIRDYDFIDKVSKMVKYHMHMLYVLKGLPFGNQARMIEETNIHDIALLCKCDRLGRIGADIEAEHNNYKEFIRVLRNNI